METLFSGQVRPVGDYRAELGESPVWAAKVVPCCGSIFYNADDCAIGRSGMPSSSAASRRCSAPHC